MESRESSEIQMLVIVAPAECSAGDRLIREVQFAYSLLSKT